MGVNRPFNRIHDIGVTIYPEKAKDGDSSLEDDFYASEIDDLDDQYVKDVYRSGNKETEAVLCCAGCFTPICYQCHFNGSKFTSSHACNVFIEGTEVEGDEFTDKITNKRGSVEDSDLQTSVLRKDRRNVNCEECCSTVATLDESGTYRFKNIIANRP
ncbi:conserved hypothetical protein [Theileria equi strain WA]|uniref:E2F-associated phosphoprotein n=1 Tax=Theileria equi strain WA TaxID=1537102 RepID=L1LFW7_THEEQ|nr:conserved hypothetical protein [Theileria equi strain WA]EKX74155.1 conserved hypothetical protein [Theileria equi strain WA]|eukprot:XP_004833607.1 conserved hypothetical protein [Theileria equi strain WA]